MSISTAPYRLAWLHTPPWGHARQFPTLETDVHGSTTQPGAMHVDFNIPISATDEFLPQFESVTSHRGGPPFRPHPRPKPRVSNKFLSPI